MCLFLRYSRDLQLLFKFLNPLAELKCLLSMAPLLLLLVELEVFQLLPESRCIPLGLIPFLLQAILCPRSYVNCLLPSLFMLIVQLARSRVESLVPFFI